MRNAGSRTCPEALRHQELMTAGPGGPGMGRTGHRAGIRGLGFKGSKEVLKPKTSEYSCWVPMPGPSAPPCPQVFGLPSGSPPGPVATPGMHFIGDRWVKTMVLADGQAVAAVINRQEILIRLLWSGM